LDYTLAEKNINDIISNSNNSQVLQHVVDYLYEHFDTYSWIGIYFVEGKYLVLGPWRGKQATEHTKIPIGMGICGSAAQSGKTELVPDVSSDPRYLSCFVSTRSEIVIPIMKNEKVIGEIDIDSDVLDAFDEQDVAFLEKIADMLGEHIC
jgi:L-methionine (R)-S-oxide reductase